MKYIFSLLLLIGTSTDIDRIAKINKLKKEAKEAFQSGDYQTAINKYIYLLDSMKVEKHRGQISLNLANAYYYTKDTVNALQSYQKATESATKTIKSMAYQQKGFIEYQQKKHKEALGSFKNALKANPANEQARYNYEMLKKLIKEQEQKQDKKDNKNQKNKDQKDKDNKDKKDNKNQKGKNKQDQKKNQDQKQKEQNKKDQQKKEGNKKKEKQKEEQKKGKEKDEKKEQKQPNKGEGNKKDQQQNQQQKKLPEGVEQKLKEMKISEEKAKMILEALKNQEVQYIQQNKKKTKKRNNNDKPDW